MSNGPRLDHLSEGTDVVLSSGFLAFAQHCGFLKAVKESGLRVRGVMGTSSGALTGSLFAAGMSPDDIADEFRRLPPIERIAVSKRPWTGVFSLEPAVQRLQDLLPAHFEDLELEFGCGVFSPAGYRILTSGNLPSAVVASAAVPLLFSPVRIPGMGNEPHFDGGVSTRIGLDAWRDMQRRKYHLAEPHAAAVHIVGRSSPFSGKDHVDMSDDVVLVHSPKSKASLWDLKNFDAQLEATYERALPLLMNFVQMNEKVL